MRFASVAVAAAVLALTATAATTLEPGPARIRLTAQQIEQRLTHTGIARTYALYNRPAYPDRLGTAVSICVRVAHGWFDCSYLLRLSRGTIITRSLVPSAAAFRLLAIVGGTGYYANVGGEMTAQPVGDGQLFLINLHGF